MKKSDLTYVGLEGDWYDALKQNPDYQRVCREMDERMKSFNATQHLAIKNTNSANPKVKK